MAWRCAGCVAREYEIGQGTHTHFAVFERWWVVALEAVFGGHSDSVVHDFANVTETFVERGRNRPVSTLA